MATRVQRRFRHRTVLVRASPVQGLWMCAYRFSLPREPPFMAIEIERKFLVLHDGWRATAGPGRRVCQGYVSRSAGNTVRIRRIGDQAFLTVKGARAGISRPEFEYEIPVADA